MALFKNSNCKINLMRKYYNSKLPDYLLACNTYYSSFEN